MKVVVLGSAGQLGTDVVRVLREQGEECVAAVRADGDITDESALKQLFAKHQPDAVINCVAYHDVGGCETDPQLAKAVNTDAVAVLTRQCRARDAKFMTVSTDYVFDGNKIEGYTEDDEPHPLNEYGRSKLAGEQLALAINPRTFVVRTQSLFGLTGPRGKGLNFVDLMVKLAGERDELKVDQCRMAPTSTVCLAQNIHALLQSDHFGLYHMSCDGATTWYEFAQKILELIDSSVRVVPVANDFYPRTFARPDNTYLINQRLAEIGLDQMPPVEDALREYLAAKGYQC